MISSWQRAAASPHMRPYRGVRRPPGCAAAPATPGTVRRSFGTTAGDAMPAGGAGMGEGGGGGGKGPANRCAVPRRRHGISVQRHHSTKKSGHRGAEALRRRGGEAPQHTGTNVPSRSGASAPRWPRPAASARRCAEIPRNRTPAAAGRPSPEYEHPAQFGTPGPALPIRQRRHPPRAGAKLPIPVRAVRGTLRRTGREAWPPAPPSRARPHGAPPPCTSTPATANGPPTQPVFVPW